MNKTRAAALTLSVAIGITLTACSGSEQSQEDGAQTINYWSWDGAPGEDIVRPIIDAFEAENPDITVNYTEIPQADYKAKVAQSLGAGEDIDVLGVQPSAWAAEIEDYLLPVAEWSNGSELESQFIPSTVEQTTRLFTDGTLMAVPVYSTGSAIGIYNADILDDLGVEPPSTWAEFAELSAAVETAGGDMLPVVMPGDDWFQDEMALTIVGQSDPEFFNSVRYDDGAWDTPSYVTGLEEYAALFTDGTFDTATLDMDYGTAMNTFDEGKAAVAFNGSWEASRILTGNYGVIPVPAESADNTSLRGFLDVLLGVPAESENQEAAALFVEFMSAGAGVDEWAGSLKGIPALDGYELPEGILTTDLQKESYALMSELISNPRSDRNNMGAFSDAVGSNVKQVVLGAMTAQEAAAADQVELDKGNF